MKFLRLKNQLCLILLSFIFSSLVQAGIPLWSFTPDPAFPPNQTVSIIDTVTVKYFVTSNTAKAHQLVMLPISGVDQVGTCVLAPYGSCTLTLLIHGSAIASTIEGGPILCQTSADGGPNLNLCYQPCKGKALNITRTPQPTVVITVTPSLLGLSINDPAINPALTGTPRIIKLTNTGIETATNLQLTFPTWPAGTTATTTCGSTLAVGASCTITITPGAVATSNGTNPCTSGAPAPIPNDVLITADHALPTKASAVILGYGCIYQSGYIFAVDDTTPNTGSIGGKAVTLSDQATQFVNGRLWSSNGNFNTVSFDPIPYIEVIPGVGPSGGPSYVQAQNQFNTSYSNTATFPFPPVGDFSICTTLVDGACNTSNIVAFYNSFKTNYGVGAAPYTLSAGPTNLSFYAAGLCKQTISGLSNWYLPAICEMGYSQLFCGGSSAAAITQNMQSNLQNTISLFSPGTTYYSSNTSDVTTLPFNVWGVNFTTISQGIFSPANPFSVRCARALTP